MFTHPARFTQAHSHPRKPEVSGGMSDAPLSQWHTEHFVIHYNRASMCRHFHSPSLQLPAARETEQSLLQ